MMMPWPLADLLQKAAGGSGDSENLRSSVRTLEGTTWGQLHFPCKRQADKCLCKQGGPGWGLRFQSFWYALILSGRVNTSSRCCF